MKLCKSVKQIKVGEMYYFVDTDFRHITIPTPTIKQKRINKIIGNSFSTKNTGDRYEEENFCPIVSKENAKKIALKQLKRYKKYLLSEIRRVEEKIKEEK